MCCSTRSSMSCLHPLHLVKSWFFSLRQRREQERKEICPWQYYYKRFQGSRDHANMNCAKHEEFNLGIDMRIAVIHSMNLSFTWKKEKSVSISWCLLMQTEELHRNWESHLKAHAPWHPSLLGLPTLFWWWAISSTVGAQHFNTQRRNAFSLGDPSHCSAVTHSHFSIWPSVFFFKGRKEFGFYRI